MRILLVVAAIVLLWSAALAGIWERLNTDAMFLVLAVAMTVTIVAALWRLAQRLHDDDHRLLLSTVADLTRPRDPRATGPIRLCR